MSAVVDFRAARSRIEAQAEHSIDIQARLIPVELEITPRATLLEILTARGCLAEVVHDAIELSK